MNALWILMLATVLCGLCVVPCSDASPAVTSGITLPLHIVEDIGKTIQNNALSVWNFTSNLEEDVTSVIERVLSGITIIPREAVAMIVSFIRTIFVNVKSLIQRTLEFVRSILNTIFGSNSSTGNRNRRGITNVLEHPIEYIENSISSTQEYVIDEIVSSVMAVIRLLWQFLSTQGIPLLHATIDEIGKTPNLPTAIRSFINTLDAGYNILHMFGIVGPTKL